MQVVWVLFAPVFEKSTTQYSHIPFQNQCPLTPQNTLWTVLIGSMSSTENSSTENLNKTKAICLYLSVYTNADMNLLKLTRTNISSSTRRPVAWGWDAAKKVTPCFTPPARGANGAFLKSVCAHSLLSLTRPKPWPLLKGRQPRTLHWSLYPRLKTRETRREIQKDKRGLMKRLSDSHVLLNNRCLAWEQHQSCLWKLLLSHVSHGLLKERTQCHSCTQNKTTL